MTELTIRCDRCGTQTPAAALEVCADSSSRTRERWRSPTARAHRHGQPGSSCPVPFFARGRLAPR